MMKIAKRLLMPYGRLSANLAKLGEFRSLQITIYYADH